ncbi:transcriptional regulator [Lujinxingia litoralis]|uniref:Transcriptional regulator n=1 Tax=Lujinxingia litoralis TaxID=2211119 RepID=A0A328CBX5_9DELT|nr:MarR family transcriptional regulator [Lujinxingia litoralis]RAL25394.1 transcriptional regulator [Lujinxingia litoralis]
MNDAEIGFIERFGLIFEGDGGPRIAGRIFGLALLGDQPMTLDDMAEVLQVSKASVSTNTRLLNGMGLLERTTVPGDRHTYYRLAPDAFDVSLARARQRIVAVLELLTDTLPELPDDNLVAQRRLSEMRNWYEFLAEDMDAMTRRWKAIKAARKEESDA